MARKRVKKETKVSEEISSVSKVLPESETSKLRESNNPGNTYRSENVLKHFKNASNVMYIVI